MKSIPLSRPGALVGFTLLLLLGASPSIAAPASRMSDAEIVEDLRSHAEQLAKEDRFSGAVQLNKNGEVLFEGAYGYADQSFRVPNKVDTKFNFGSMGKTFTVVSVLQLLQQGKLSSLDAKLIEVLPDFPNKEAASKVTIRQLMKHESGMGNIFGPEFDKLSKDKLATLESLLPLFASKPLAFEPGTRAAYSNGGYITLGLVIQKLSGQSYYDYVDQHVFKAAGMNDTGNWGMDEVVPNRANGYTTTGAAPGKRRNNVFSLQRGGSAGGGYTTVGDLQRFWQALQDGKFLDKKHADLLTEYLHPETLNGTRRLAFGGGYDGISAILYMYPDLGYAVSILSNYDFGAYMLVDKLNMQLIGQPIPEAIKLSGSVLKRYAGSFVRDPKAPPPMGTPPGTLLPPIAVAADKEGLWVEFMPGQKRRYLPLSETEFFDFDNPTNRLAFTRNEKGEVTGFTTSGGFTKVSAVKQS